MALFLEFFNSWREEVEKETPRRIAGHYGRGAIYSSFLILHSSFLIFHFSFFILTEEVGTEAAGALERLLELPFLDLGFVTGE